MEAEVRANNHACVMLEKARQVTTTVDQNLQRPQRYQMARSGGAALMDCSMHFQGNRERAWPNIKKGDITTGRSNGRSHESTPGAFGVSDAGAELRSIGVAELSVSEGAAQLQKRLDRGKLRPDLRLRPDEEAGIQKRLAKIEITKSESLRTQGQPKIEVIASASISGKRGIC